MRKLTIAAFAALMALAASPAQAINWVEYTLSGYGYMTTRVYQGSQVTTSASWSFVDLILTVDTDVTPDGSPVYSGSSTGTDFQRLGFRNGPIMDRATFTSNTISATSSESGGYYTSDFSGHWNGSSGSMALNSSGGRNHTGVVFTTFNGSVSRLSVRNVDASQVFRAEIIASSPAPAPEPATWGLMLIGFGLVGAGLRSRRRTVTYA